jgi:hypothetical protein
VIQVPPYSIRDLARMIHPMLKPATDTTRGKVTPGQILERAEQGTMQVWLGGERRRAPRVVVITELVNYPAHKGCVILLAAGREMSTWSHLIADIESWARAEGCRTIEIQGRKGWGRVFPDYRPMYQVFEKELHDG